MNIGSRARIGLNDCRMFDTFTTMRGAVTVNETDCGPFTIRVARYAPACVMARHAHDRTGVSVVLAGALVEEAEHRMVAVGPGQVVLKPRGLYHANRFSPDGALILAIDFDRAAEPELFPAGVLRAWRWTRNPSLLRASLRLVRVTSEAGASDADVADLVHDLVAIATLTEARKRPIPGWVVTARESIEAADVPPTPSDVARRCGYHRAHVARAFRESYGMSMREYRQVVQVRRASGLMATSRRSLSEIAHQCGFSDHSHMCRVFASVTGVAPGRFRAAL